MQILISLLLGFVLVVLNAICNPLSVIFQMLGVLVVMLFIMTAQHNDAWWINGYFYEWQDYVIDHYLGEMTGFWSHFIKFHFWKTFWWRNKHYFRYSGRSEFRDTAYKREQYNKRDIPAD